MADPEPESLPVDPQPVPDEWEGAGSATAAEAAQAVAQAEDRLLRLAAEYDNYRKRTNREKTEAFDRGSTALVVRLLDVLDDIDRLSASDPVTTTYESFRAAFDLMQKKLAKELEGAGLERIDPVGAPFDPTQHEAVTHEDSGEHQPGQVIGVIRQGYRIGDRVIRPALVRVAR